MKGTILKYSFILLIGFLLEWWIIWFSPLNLPERIPATPIRIDGLILVGLLLTVLIMAEKQFLRNNPNTTIFNLTVIGTTICFLAEIVFQAIRQPFINAYTFSEHLYYYLLGIIVVTLYGAALSFLIAFQLKRKNIKQLLFLIIAFAAIVNLIKYIFPKIGQ